APSRPARSGASARGSYNPPDPGRLAQLGEHQLDKLGVTGSSPVPPTRLKKPDPAQVAGLRRLKAQEHRQLESVENRLSLAVTGPRLAHSPGTACLATMGA